MQAHIFQHLAFEGPGNIQPWLLKQGFEVSYTVFSANLRIPGLDEIDFLVIMGGSMSANDEEKYPWLIEEKRFIRNFISTGKPALGICLGAQLIASSLGARVYPNNEKEIGWFPVEGSGSLPQSCFRFPASFTPLHWHGETFDLPDGAVHLASSEACANQAFQYGNKVLALQFHPEINEDTLNDFIHHFKDELIPGNFIQTDHELLAGGVANILQMELLIEKILIFLVA
jgi:GMP synthase-like glutamine amidotransferase